MTRAAQGAADPMSALGYASGVESHAVCQEVRTFVGGAGKRALMCAVISRSHRTAGRVMRLTALS